MNKKVYSVYTIGIVVVKEETIIGKRMVVKDNSYIVTRNDKQARGALYGKVVEITSEPFEEVIVSDIGGTPHTHTFVYARSLESGVEYRVLWDVRNLTDADDIVPKTDVRGRMIILSDGSYSKEIGGDKHIYGCERAKMIIVSNPYVRDCTEKHDSTTYKYVFVDAYNLKDGKIYSVLFNEANLINEADVKSRFQ